ncbi:unnamed protein product [Arabis nemorensis]|uniref:non-specific serine/threonine protein kinase n=1 Tax=Arabis nemorensis TaxID=586526 RepID=A0A565B7L3_9BRAS|nr:unnamed protein product [Arabis nemorensis]
MLGDEIGKGAYGRVYIGLDLENGDFVAIKQVSLENIVQEDLNTIMQEIDLLKNLNHKNIVKYLGSLKTKTHLHIILEYVENGSLANIIKPNKFGPFPESLVTVYIAQVLEGLVYLHEQGVIHRDIKGANILTTKEGLVKLADFGVATKLNEADANTHSVVGTPYWMAPEVIEMSGVCAASDIWSVGCTVIELLTCVPPYYDLQPMPALFRIVQDDSPPIPDSLSPDITDFLRQCFKKDSRQRPDAKTLLSHPWIRNSRRALQSSLRHSGTIRYVKETSSSSEKDDEGSQDVAESISAEKVRMSKKNSKSKLPVANFRSEKAQSSPSDLGEEGTDSEDDLMSDQVSTLSIHDKSSLQSGTCSISSDAKGTSQDLLEFHGKSEHDEIPGNLETEAYEGRRNTSAKKQVGKECSIPVKQISHSFSQIGEDRGRRKAVKTPSSYGGNELTRFSDPPGDACLHDLFHPLDKVHEGKPSEASTSTPTSNVNQGDSPVADGGKNDLATKLRARIAQKQMEGETGHSNDGGDLFRLMMGVLKDDVIDIDGLVFDEKVPAENLFPLQAVEFSRLVSFLRPDESEDAIVTSCQKLVAMFRQRPEQKAVFVTQHGFLPLMDLLDIPKSRVVCAVLQLINEIIKDNTEFQENACLVGLIPVVISFAGSERERSREIRKEAAYFLQQLCQSSSLTLQMFIACRGIPVLVGFLEADYAKYREMVHLAIDGMWQVFKLKRSSPRNDFCRIAAKNGILLRLINTLYSLNEATRLASMSGIVDDQTPRARSGQLDYNNPIFSHHETSFSVINHPDVLTTRHGGGEEPSHASVSSSQRFDIHQPELDGDRPRLSSVAPDVTDDVRQQHRISLSANRTSTDKLQKLAEGAFNGFPVTQPEQVRPLLSLLEKEPPSRHFSGQLDYVKHITGMDRHESRLPLLHASSEKKTNGDLDFLRAEFAEVSGRGKENGNVDTTPRYSCRTMTKKVMAIEGVASTSGIASRTASGVLSGSGVLNARPGSASSSGVLAHMVSTLSADVAREYLEKVADLLLEFARAETTVKSYMCSQSLLSRLFQMFNRVEPPILLKILQCTNHLSTDPNCLENLQRADAIKHLIPNLELKDGNLVDQIHHEVLCALFNLCKINKRRQEQAAENGIIPHLLLFIMSDSPLKQYALPLLCDMAHASRNSREQLRAHGGLDVYLSLLDDEYWSVVALDSIAVCLAQDNDNRKVEQALLKKDAIQKLVNFFQSCPERHFVHILEPFLKITTKSSRINTTLAVNGLTPLLISRLDHQDAIARLNLLKLIKAVYEHHPRPKQLIVENNLPQKLQNLIEERRDGQRSGGQVLVKQMATSLLKALHINTVL